MALDLVLKEVETGVLKKTLSEVWPLVEKARAEFGVAQTTVEMDLGNLQFSGETPITWLSQCAAQSEKKVNALHEAFWRLKKQKRKIEKLRAKGDDDSLLKAEEMESSIKNSEHYIKTAVQDVLHYQHAAAKIREKWGIPEDLTAEQLAENSKREHIRKSMRQALRDIENTGTISKGVSEHLEHYGIHPMTARMQVQQYRQSVQNLFEQNKAPTMEHLTEWLDVMEQIHFKGADKMLEYMRLVEKQPEN